MKLKKLTSLVLSGAMLFGAAFFAPSKADEVSTSYFDSLKNVATWDKAESKQDLNLKLDLKALGEDNFKDFSTTYNLKLDSVIDTEAKSAKLTAKFTSPVTQGINIPEVMLYLNKNDIYVNKDAFNMYMSGEGYSKKTDKEFVKMTFDKALAKAMGTDANFYTKVMDQSMSKETSKKMFDYLSKIDIGVDLGLTKDGDTYKLSWNSDKMVDVVNAYMKYIFKNPDTFLNMYKDVYGVDLLAEMKKSDSTMTEAKFRESMKEAETQWAKEAEPMLPQVKKLIAGSSLTIEENFAKEDYTQKLNFKLAIDLARFQEISDGTKYTKPMVISAELSSNASSKKMEKVDLTLPTSVEEFDIVKYTEEENKKLRSDIQKMKDEEMKLVEQGKSNTTTYSLDSAPYPNEKPHKVTLNPAKNELRVYMKGEAAPAMNIEVKNERGVVYIPTETMEDEILFKTIDTEQTHVPFKSTLEKNNYTVTVDNKTGILTATKNVNNVNVKPFKVTVKPSTKELRVYVEGEVAPAMNVESRVTKGVLYIPTEIMEDDILMKPLDTNQAYVPFKSTMEKNGYRVYWDKSTRTTVAEKK